MALCPKCHRGTFGRHCGDYPNCKPVGQITLTRDDVQGFLRVCTVLWHEKGFEMVDVETCADSSVVHLWTPPHYNRDGIETEDLKLQDLVGMTSTLEEPGGG